MKIKLIKWQSRRDFYADYECEKCGHVEQDYGYDDRNYHDNVVPKRICPECEQSTLSLGIKPQQRATKYPEDYSI